MKLRNITVAASPRVAFVVLTLCAAVGCSGGGGGSGSGFGMARDEIALGDGTDSVTLNWDPPQTDSTGARLKEDVGFRLYHCTVPGEFEVVTLGSVNGVLVHGLQSGDHEFTVTTVTPSGAESDPSDPVDITLP